MLANFLFGAPRREEPQNNVQRTANDPSVKVENGTNYLQELYGNDLKDPSKLPEWKQRMIAKNEAAKKEVTDIMDDSMRRVMAKIEQKPEAQRGSAVDGYVSSVDWIMWSVKAVIARVK